MMYRLLIAIAIGLVFIVSSFAGTWEDGSTFVRKATKIYKVEYQNGDRGRFLIEFAAYVYARLHEDGSPSRWNHPIDTRRCSYIVQARVERKGYILIGGQQIESKDMAKLFGPKAVGGGDASTLENILGIHKPCSDYKGEFDRKKEEAKNRVKDMFGFFVDDLWSVAATDAGAILSATLEEHRQ